MGFFQRRQSRPLKQMPKPWMMWAVSLNRRERAIDKYGALLGERYHALGLWCGDLQAVAALGEAHRWSRVLLLP
jgi:hypothetical protein